MSYQIWLEEHAAKHKKILKKLLAQGASKEEIIDYFEFENMVQKELDFCPLYAQNKKCHESEYLNCYLCACPNFRFNDQGLKSEANQIKYSLCAIDSKDGKSAVYGDAIHQDCSACGVAHVRSFIEKNFDLDLKNIMGKCCM